MARLAAPEEFWDPERANIPFDPTQSQIVWAQIESARAEHQTTEYLV